MQLVKSESKAKYNFKHFIRKNMWWLISLTLIILFFIAYVSYYIVTKEWFDLGDTKLGTVVGAVFGASAFFLTTITILQALTGKNEYICRFLKTKHPLVILKAGILGMISSIILILIYILTDKFLPNIIFIIIPIGQMFVQMYYIYHLFKGYLESANNI